LPILCSVRDPPLRRPPLGPWRSAPAPRDNIHDFAVPEVPGTPEEFAAGLTTYVVLLFSLSFHESAHAWVALRMGDTTAHDQGRITLNPLPHIELFGTVIFPLILLLTNSGMLFGWANPTPVNPRAFREARRGELLVSGAGPLSNLVLAVACTLALAVVLRTDVARNSPILKLLVVGVQLNVILALFNLIPLPPLDGSHVLRSLLPTDLAEGYQRVIGPYGAFILLALFASGALGWILTPFLSAIVSFLFAIARP